MSNPLGNAVKLAAPPAERIIAAVKFKEHGRAGEGGTVRELYASAKRAKDKQPHTLDESDPRGIVIDDKILVPYANILWVEYE